MYFSFNRTFKENILDAYLFEDTLQVQILAEGWKQDYKYSKPHEALGGKTPNGISWPASGMLLLGQSF